MEDKMEEIRLVNKAKWLLISNEGLLEPEAHRYLEKEAMDRCISKKAVAEELSINTVRQSKTNPNRLNAGC
jgi:response regulator NasT